LFVFESYLTGILMSLESFKSIRSTVCHVKTHIFTPFLRFSEMVWKQILKQTLILMSILK